MSLVMMMCELAMKTHSVRSRLAVLGVAQRTLTLAVFWPGECLSGFLIHITTTIAPLSRLWSASIVHSWVSSSGEKEPLHGTNFITTWYMHGWIFTVLQIHLSRLLFLQYVLKRSVYSFDSNLSSIAPRSVNWSTLIGDQQSPAKCGCCILCGWQHDRRLQLITSDTTTILPYNTYERCSDYHSKENVQ